jgi:uncharacterized protein YjbJ (UPF0337 family)
MSADSAEAVMERAKKLVDRYLKGGENRRQGRVGSQPPDGAWFHRNPCPTRPFTLTTSKGDIPMDWNRVEGSWKQVTGKVKEQWGKLTDDDLTQINGNREQLEGKIQERYGKAKDDVRRDVDDWYNRQTW